MTRLRAGGATDVGLARANNQDQLLVATAIFAVADGMGGHAAGEVASQTAVDALRRSFEASAGPSLVASPQSVVEAAQAANRAVWNRAQAHSELRGMGTTLTAVALVVSDGVEVLAVVNVGDSRTYRLRDGGLEQVTVDHSYVAELLAGGRIGQAEAEVHPQRHVLTRALGVGPDVDVDLLVLAPRSGDRYLLCSDGLSREVTDARVAATLRRLATPDGAARALVSEAKLNGGNDNITVVVVDVVDAGADDDDDGDPTEMVPAVAPDATGLIGVPVPTGGAGAPGDLVARRPEPPVTPQPVTAAGAGRDAGPGRRRRRREARLPQSRAVTGRVVAFVVLLAALVFAAAAGTAYYARSAYYVGLEARQLTIFQGRPGGVLWWKPTIAARTGVTTAEVDAYHLASLRAGVQESSMCDANSYVTRLRAEKAAAGPTPIAAVTGAR